MMATTRTERRDSGGVLWLAALLLAALLAVLGRVHPASVADVMLTEHATERHGKVWTTATNCGQVLHRASDL